MSVILTPINNGDDYASVAGIQAHGFYNANVAADIESTGDADEIAARYSAAVTRSNNVVMYEAGKLNPGVQDLSTVIPASTDTTYYPEIVEGANTFSLGWLLMGRQEAVAPNKLPVSEELMQKGRKQIIDALTTYKNYIDPTPQVASTFAEIPIRRGANCVDEHSGW
jgi:hypothetical protein